MCFSGVLWGVFLLSMSVLAAARCASAPARVWYLNIVTFCGGFPLCVTCVVGYVSSVIAFLSWVVAQSRRVGGMF